ncbi:MAG: HAD family phosphatase [Flavobacteriales bacterium]|nr:HAD family phosphatase [Flavobacteriales bacterium]MDW8432853.1 HAD family phosphatase [Flavobacteriales bacterium]
MTFPTPLSGPRAILFDMDGVIVDSEPLWRKAEIEVFSRFGIFLTDEACRSTQGLRLDEVVRLRMPLHPPAEQRQARRSIMRRVAELVEREPVDPGLIEFMNLTESLKIQRALCTSSPPRLIHAVLKHTGCAFHKVVSAWTMKRPKPHPACYILCLQKLGLKAEECWCIEDSFRGMVSALAAGLPVWIKAENTLDHQPWHGAAVGVFFDWKELAHRLLAAFNPNTRSANNRHTFPA